MPQSTEGLLFSISKCTQALSRSHACSLSLFLSHFSIFTLLSLSLPQLSLSLSFSLSLFLSLSLSLSLSQCHKILEGSFFNKQEKLFCESCHDLKFLPRCKACSQPIKGPGEIFFKKIQLSIHFYILF